MRAPVNTDRPVPSVEMLDADPGWPDWADPAAAASLRDAVRANTIGHAYLLAGQKGVGKRQLARAFAQALCCTNPDPADPSQPCGECRACRNVRRGTHPDVELFDLYGQTALGEKSARVAALSIDSIRRLRASAALLPLESSRRILIVDDAETLQEPAQQALLKMLEEPPRTVTILLLADEPEALLETVRSRCRTVMVRCVSDAAISNALTMRGVKDATAHEIARLSRGAPAWALSAAADRKLLEARRRERESAVSWVESAPYERLAAAYKLGDQFSSRRGEVIATVQAAVQYLRDAMIRAASGGEPGPADEAAVAVDGVSALALSSAVAASLQCLADLDANVRPKLALEAMVLAWPSLRLKQP